MYNGGKRRVIMLRRFHKTVLCVLTLFMLMGTGHMPVQAENLQEMNLYGMYVNSTEKGDSVLLESEGEYLLMDLGMYSHMPAICEQLHRLGITSLNLYFSHLHIDHVGGQSRDWLAGLKYLADQGFTINTLYLPDPSLAPESEGYQTKYSLLEEYMNTYMGGSEKIVYLQQGSMFTVGSVEAEVLGPSLDFVQSIHPQDYIGKVDDDDLGTEHGAVVVNTYYENNCSLITRFSCGSVRYLTTGDMLKDEATYMVINYVDQLQADIYKISHHATATGNTKPFLTAVDPTYSFAQNAGSSYISPDTNQWRFENVCQVTSATSMPYFIANEKKTIIYHVENGRISLYKGNTVEDGKKLTGWVGVYGADGVNREKDFYYLDGDSEPLIGVQTIGSHSFLFNNGGCMIYGDYDEQGNYQPWKVYSNGKKRYFYWSDTGNLAYMAMGFQKIDQKLYYFNQNGIKLEGSEEFTIVDIGNDSYGIEPDGSVVTDCFREYKDNFYYFTMDGKMAWKQIIPIDDHLYYFGVYGTQVFDKMITLDGKKYYFDENGDMVKDQFLELDGKRYYFDENGRMAQRSLIKEDGQYRYFGKYGTQVSDVEVKINGKTYYFDENGFMVRAQMYDRDGKTYYFDKTGVMAIQKKIKYQNNIYYFGKYGTMVRSKKVRINGYAYYFDEDGKMYRNTTKVINGRTYEFAADGRMKVAKTEADVETEAAVEGKKK